MTDTHDGSHTWLKYVSRREKLADQLIKDFILFGFSPCPQESLKVKDYWRMRREREELNHDR